MTEESTRVIKNLTVIAQVTCSPQQVERNRHLALRTLHEEDRLYVGNDCSMFS